MTVGEMLARMSSRELSTWMALARLETEDRRREELSRAARAGVAARSPTKGL